MPKRKRYGRDINGVILLDKPTGITSNSALQTVKRLFKANKAGHTGSLDPLATGMLPICFGEATKFSQFLLNADKGYFVTAKLGVKTNTGDSDGEIIASNEINVSEKEFHQTIENYKGEILQTPSMFSALKHQGQPLYKLAREGKEVERAARPVNIYQLKLLDFSLPFVQLDVKCSKGTYIRSLVEDIGKELGCGAHVTQLRRVNVAHFDNQNMYTIEALKQQVESLDSSNLEELLLPVEEVIATWPRVELPEEIAYYLKQGQAVMVPGLPKQGLVSLFEVGYGFVGMGEVLADGRVAPKRLISQS